MFKMDINLLKELLEVAKDNATECFNAAVADGNLSIATEYEEDYDDLVEFLTTLDSGN